MTTTWTLRCEYCRTQCTGTHAWIESRPGKVIKRDGQIIETTASFYVCDACHRRLPVDR